MYAEDCVSLHLVGVKGKLLYRTRDFIHHNQLRTVIRRNLYMEPSSWKVKIDFCTNASLEMKEKFLGINIAKNYRPNELINKEVHKILVYEQYPGASCTLGDQRDAHVTQPLSASLLDSRITTQDARPLDCVRGRGRAGGGAGAHTLHLGRTCPNVQPFPNLSLDKVLGAWYVVHKFDTDNTCLMWNLTRGELPDTLLVTETRQLSVLDTFGVDHTHAITAKVDIPNPEVPSKMRIRWPTCRCFASV
nr:uncharacterized protein LOC113800824 [Penaeus vannamei]